jgi:hypothetical protein
MEREGEKVQGHEHGGKIGFPVPEVVFEIVSVILQDVENLFADGACQPMLTGMLL